MYGPFRGLNYEVKTTWGDPCSKLLGAYEFCLHEVIYEVIDQFSGYSVVDLGCAEGYYAAGLAAKLGSNAILIADTNKASLEQCKQLINSNCSHIKVTEISYAKPGPVATFLSDNPNSVVFVDIEGFEKDLFDDCDFISKLREAVVIVELHEFVHQGICQSAKDSLEETHEVQILREIDPSPEDYPEIANLDGISRSLALCESRPIIMKWIYAKPKNYI